MPLTLQRLTCSILHNLFDRMESVVKSLTAITEISLLRDYTAKQTLSSELLLAIFLILF